MLNDREIRRGIQELTIKRHRHCTTRHTPKKPKQNQKHQKTTKNQNKPKQKLNRENRMVNGK